MYEQTFTIYIKFNATVKLDIDEYKGNRKTILVAKQLSEEFSLRDHLQDIYNGVFERLTSVENAELVIKDRDYKHYICFEIDGKFVFREIIDFYEYLQRNGISIEELGNEKRQNLQTFDYVVKDIHPKRFTFKKY